MVEDRPVHTTLPATDLERAKRFYAEKLGLRIESEAPGGVFYQSGNTHFLVYPSQRTASGEHTQMGWTVDDIEAPAGRLALALLLSGSGSGSYGLKASAADGILPPIEP